MSEWLEILTMTVSGSLFAIGGTKGKFWRRYVLPLFLAFICVLSLVSWWQSSLYAVGLCVALSCGYGERTAYWLKFLIFCAYSGVSLCIGFSWWVIITPVILILLFFASNWKPLASTVFWKAWEFIAGTLIGISLIASILNKW
jgi:hypothetical protein